jgi:hypothetical protein
MALRQSRGLLASALGIAIVLCVSTARADPQWGLGVTVGGGAVDVRGSDSRAAFHLGGRGDVLFLRARNSDMALGLYIDASSEAFETINVGGGAEWLLPTSDLIAVVLSAGAVAERAPGFGWEPGGESTIFVGSREYNFDSHYALGTGLFVQGRYSFGDSKEADVIAGAQIDLSFFAYPFVFAYNAIRK